jgi:GntR family transcriptional regulator
MSRGFFNPFPKYLQVREILRRRIASDLRPGDAFPTEHELVREFAVSRETVRQALVGLEAEGLIDRRAGIGTTVRQLPATRADARLTGLVEDFTTLGLDTETRLLFKGVVAPPAEVADALQLGSGDCLYRIERLRRLDGIPLAHHDAFLPEEIGREIAQHSLRRATVLDEIARLGRSFREDFQKIDATLADPPIAAQLEIQVGAPLLVVTRVFSDERERPAVFFRSRFRADRYVYTARLRDDPAAPSRQPPARRGRRKTSPSQPVEERHG